MALLTLILFIITTAALPACGTGASGTIDSAFLNRANAICASAVADHAKHPFPFTSFDPLHPDPSKLPELADYFRLYGPEEQTTNQLIALGEPTAGRSRWDALIALLKKAYVNRQQQIAAARDQDIPLFVGTVKSAAPIHDALAKTGRQAGFTSSSACAQIYS